MKNLENPSNGKFHIWGTFKGLCHQMELKSFNPFIFITLSMPLMSSGSWLTLHNCMIFNLLAVNYDPATTNLIFIKVNIYPGPGEGGSQPIFLPIHFIRVTIYPVSLPHNISRGHYLPGGRRRRLTG